MIFRDYENKKRLLFSVFVYEKHKLIYMYAHKDFKNCKSFSLKILHKQKSSRERNEPPINIIYREMVVSITFLMDDAGETVCMSLDELGTNSNLINLSRYCGMLRSPPLFRMCNYPNAQRVFCV